MKTQRGLSVTTNSPEAIECINHFHRQILSYGQSAADIINAAQLFPDNLLIQTYAAAFYLYAQENQATKIASAYLVEAEKQLRGSNLREKLTYHATTAWLRLDYEAALSLFTAVAKLFPRDTLAVKFAEWLFYCSGQAFQAKWFLAVCEAVAKENQDEPHFLATHSFALELCGRRAEAKAMAEQAISMNPQTPWAHHTLAHVLLFDNAIEEGITSLSRFKASWDTLFSLLKSHNTWHLALFYLADRNEKESIKLFNGIFGTLPETCGEQIDAISLLWRMDIAGLPQHPLFHSLIPFLGVHPYEQYTGFNTAHFIYCLAKAGETKQVNDSLKSIEKHINSLPVGVTQNLWCEVNFPLCKAVAAFAQEDYQTSYRLLEPIIERCTQIGGSDAQDELFIQTYLISLLRTQQKNKAKQFFDHHLSHYKNTALADYWFL
ncbi:tetratricopeptide repeat protein [Legionella sp.]|uniref:tetratricopeptide repeat protein n=1 Tax=Legionella sp. TaxID=459 RepID=UPI00321F9CDD